MVCFTFYVKLFNTGLAPVHPCEYVSKNRAANGVVDAAQSAGDNAECRFGVQGEVLWGGEEPCG